MFLIKTQIAKEELNFMGENYVEIPLANEYKIIISKADGVFVALENPNGYIVSDTKLTKEQEDFLKS